MPLERFPVIDSFGRTAGRLAGGAIRGIGHFFAIEGTKAFPFVKPTPFAVTYAAPQPIGFVPARVFHLDRRWLGVTFADILSTPFTGRKEPQDVTRQTAAGEQLYVYALQQIRRAPFVTEVNLRRAADVYKRANAGRVTGLTDRETIAASIVSLELQRRAGPGGVDIEPFYRAGGGVGVRFTPSFTPVYRPSAPAAPAAVSSPAARVAALPPAGGIAGALVPASSLRGVAVRGRVRRVLISEPTVIATRKRRLHVAH